MSNAVADRQCCRRAWGVDGISNGEPNPCQQGPENVSLANNTGPLPFCHLCNKLKRYLLLLRQHSFLPQLECLASLTIATQKGWRKGEIQSVWLNQIVHWYQRRIWWWDGLSKHKTIYKPLWLQKSIIKRQSACSSKFRRNYQITRRLFRLLQSRLRRFQTTA